ncbi:MAG: oligosaccharide flippase family protein [Caldilineaceae bacterium]
MRLHLLGLSLVYGRADVAIVAIWLGNVAVGIYSPAVSLVMTALLIPLTIYNVILPLLSRAHAEDRRALARLSLEATAGSAPLGLLMAGTLALLSHVIVRIILGEQYQDVGTVLFILSGVLLFRAPSFVLAAIITAVGWQTQRYDPSHCGCHEYWCQSLCGHVGGLWGLQRSSC